MTVGGASAERLREIDLVQVGLEGCVEEVGVKDNNLQHFAFQLHCLKMHSLLCLSSASP